MDKAYHREKLELVLRDLRHYTPEEYARELMRLVVVASPLTMADKEFTQSRIKAIYEHEQKTKNPNWYTDH